MQTDDYYDLENPYAPPPEPKQEKRLDYTELAVLVDSWEQYRCSGRRAAILLQCSAVVFLICIYFAMRVGMTLPEPNIFVTISLCMALGMFGFVHAFALYDSLQRKTLKSIRSMLPEPSRSWRSALEDIEQAKRLLAAAEPRDIVDSTKAEQNASETGNRS